MTYLFKAGSSADRNRKKLLAGNGQYFESYLFKQFCYNKVFTCLVKIEETTDFSFKLRAMCSDEENLSNCVKEL